jgi:hypothetical protein
VYSVRPRIMDVPRPAALRTRNTTKRVNQRIEQRRRKAADLLFPCKRADHVCDCPSTHLKHVKQTGLGDHSARSKSNGWRIRGGQLSVIRASGDQNVASACHWNAVYRAV